MLGTQTQSGMMEGTGKSTEAWRHPQVICFSIFSSVWSPSLTERLYLLLGIVEKVKFIAFRYIGKLKCFKLKFRLKTLWINFNQIVHLLPFIENLKESFSNLHYLSMMGNPAAPGFVNGGIYHDYLIYRYISMSVQKSERGSVSVHNCFCLKKLGQPRPLS